MFYNLYISFRCVPLCLIAFGSVKCNKIGTKAEEFTKEEEHLTTDLKLISYETFNPYSD